MPDAPYPPCRGMPRASSASRRISLFVIIIMNIIKWHSQTHSLTSLPRVPFANRGPHSQCSSSTFFRYCSFHMRPLFAHSSTRRILLFRSRRSLLSLLALETPMLRHWNRESASPALKYLWSPRTFAFLPSETHVRRLSPRPSTVSMPFSPPQRSPPAAAKAAAAAAAIAVTRYNN